MYWCVYNVGRIIIIYKPQLSIAFRCPIVSISVPAIFILLFKSAGSLHCDRLLKKTVIGLFLQIRPPLRTTRLEVTQKNATHHRDLQTTTEWHVPLGNALDVELPSFRTQSTPMLVATTAGLSIPGNKVPACTW